MQLFSADAICCVFKKKIKFFFEPQNMKKLPSKVAYNRPRPFYFTVSTPVMHNELRFGYVLAVLLYFRPTF